MSQRPIDLHPYNGAKPNALTREELAVRQALDNATMQKLADLIVYGGETASLSLKMAEEMFRLDRTMEVHERIKTIGLINAAAREIKQLAQLALESAKVFKVEVKAAPPKNLPPNIGDLPE